MEKSSFCAITRVRVMIGLFLASTLWLNPCCAEYRTAPSLRWSLQLEGSGNLSSRGMRKGNAVVAHKDGIRVVATLDDGSLHIVQTTPQVRTISVFEPPAVDDKFTECRSGPVLVYPGEESDATAEEFPSGTPSAAFPAAQGKSYAIYTVVDASIFSDIQFDEFGLVIPNDASEGSTTSRVLAVNLHDGSLKWSVQVPGRIQGDVVVGTTGLYISHNVGNEGYLSVIMMDQDGTSANVVATLDFSSGGNGPFGPPALQSNSGVGDVVIVAESWGQGYSQELGGLYMLSPSSDFASAGGRGNDAYQVQKIGSWPYSAIAAPLVDGNSVFLGAAGGILVGWTGNQRNDLSGISSGRVEEIEPRWVYQMNPNPRNQSQPVMSSPVIDSTGGLLCTPGVSSDFYCLVTGNGRIAWSATTESQIMVRPHIWDDISGSVIYAIESMNGRITQFDLYTGETYWQYSCADIFALDQMCQASVEAEFAIAPSGNILYYGDIFGRITSLQIASFETDAPTAAPSGSETNEPTQIATTIPPPTGAPTAEDASSLPDEEQSGETLPTEFESPDVESDSISEQQQSQQQGDNSNLGVYIGAALGGLFLLLVPVVVFWLMRGGKHRSSKNDEVIVEIIDDFDKEYDSESGDFEDIEVSTDTSTADGIEIEYLGSKTIAATPPKRKKKRRKKSPQNQTPQTAITLESIQENDEEAVPRIAQGSGIKAKNLCSIFDMAASDSSSSSESPCEERDASLPITPGDVGIAAGTHHLELAVGRNNNSDLSPLYPTHVGSNDSDETSGLPPPPPPPTVTLTSSKNQWSWGMLLNLASSQSLKDNDATTIEKTALSKNEQVLLKPVDNVGRKNGESSDVNRNTSPDPQTDEVSHRAKTPPVSNHCRDKPSSPDNLILEEKHQPNFSKRSWPGSDKEEPTLSPKSSLVMLSESKDNAEEEEEDDAELKIKSTSKVQTADVENVEEEKKENEEVLQRNEATTPAPHTMDATRDAMSPFSRVSEQSNGRVLSPSSHSQTSGYLDSPLSPSRSPSNLSTDDSLFTSATGATGEKLNDTSNLSPLSTNLFGRDIIHRERSDIPHDEAKESLSTPDLTEGENDKFGYLREDKVITERKNDKFRYLRVEEEEEEDIAPDDEVITAPGFQYMTSSDQEVNGGDKYGRSVRSKRDSATSFRSKLAKQDSFGSTRSGSESPLAVIYSQLASMGQKQAEENRKKHSFKRRSKKLQRESSPQQDSDSEQQESNDTWGNFLQELAEAEQQFFAPTTVKPASLLKTSESHDSEDSEVARINNTRYIS
ncbi:PQQ-like domain containing protein [Nitzschia inconspicua]|uniref:PQQ-like domain containing protein n=1 Tax=Nitzschia inconspicua TaxID=303405 RepID=A0A9K3LV48_9STRA|nr:PQQ-like domain containing protein [Nitzschia inconspicua]